MSEGTTEPEPPPKKQFDLARLEAVTSEVLELEQLALDVDQEAIADHLSDASSDLRRAIELAVAGMPMPKP